MTAGPAYAPLPSDQDGLFAAVEQVEAALIHLEDVALARATRAALAEGGEPIPAEDLWAELGL
jgi:hypothetical protein